MYGKIHVCGSVITGEQIQPIPWLIPLLGRNQSRINNNAKRSRFKCLGGSWDDEQSVRVCGKMRRRRKEGFKSKLPSQNMLKDFLPCLCFSKSLSSWVVWYLSLSSATLARSPVVVDVHGF